MISDVPGIGSNQSLITSLISSSNTASTTVEQGITDSLQGNAFRIKLEKHLHDHETGKGYLSEDMYGINDDKDKRNAEVLANTNPKAALLYDSYMTAGFSYDKKARFITGIESTVDTESRLKSLSETA